MRNRVFNNPKVVAQSWYVAGRSTDLRPGRVTSFELADRRFALFRDAEGRPRALDSVCPHLGADLKLGRVANGALQCAFHGWTFGGDGACLKAPGCASPSSRRAASYPVVERWGLVWIFNGPRALFQLPERRLTGRARVLRLPAQTIRCHPHLVIANGLDASHYESLHAFEQSVRLAIRAESDFELALDLRGRPRSRNRRVMTGTHRCDVEASFSTIGSNVAWAVVRSPVEFEVLFTGRPDRDGLCVTQTIIFLPAWQPFAAIRSAVLLATLLRDDRRVLDSIRFHPDLAECDTGLAAFRDLIDATPTQ